RSVEWCLWPSRNAASALSDTSSCPLKAVSPPRRTTPLQIRSMATGSGRAAPPSSRTLPEIKVGWIISGVVGARLVMLGRGGGLLGVPAVFWATPAVVSSAAPISIQVLKQEEPSFIALSNRFSNEKRCYRPI